MKLKLDTPDAAVASSAAPPIVHSGGLKFMFDIVRVRVRGGTVKGWKFSNDRNAGAIRCHTVAVIFFVLDGAIVHFVSVTSSMLFCM